MTVTKVHTVSVNAHVNLGGYSWNREDLTFIATEFTPPSGFTLFKVESDVYCYASSAGNLYFNYFGGSNGPYLIIPQGTRITRRLTWTGLIYPSDFSDSNFTYGISGGGSGSVTVNSFIFYYTKTSTVTAGNKINASDWTDVGLSATAGDKIVRPSDVSGLGSAIIYASEWNSASVTVTF